MIIEIECAGCGARRKLSAEKGQYVETLLRQGWDSFRGEIYCPDCMKVRNITLTGRLRPDGSFEINFDFSGREGDDERRKL